MTKAILIAVAVALVAWYASYTRGEIARLRASEALSRQNLTALADTLRTVRLDNGEIESSRLLVVAERDDLKNLNESLSRRVSRLRGELAVAISAQGTMASTDTVFVPVTDEVRTDTSRVWKWAYDPTLPAGNRLVVSGRSGIVQDSAFTKVTSHQIAIDMAFGVRKREDNLYEVVGTSSWPGLVLNVEGAILEPDWIVPKRGPSRLKWLGIGFGLGVIVWEVAR